MALSLLPAVSGDLFGPKFTTRKYGLLFTARGMAALLVSPANRLHKHAGSSAPDGDAVAEEFRAALRLKDQPVEYEDDDPDDTDHDDEK